MVVRTRRKVRKLRGRTRSMGWGRIGQHRKSGSRGGKGAAGMHKHKWTWVIKYAPAWYGKRGFNPPRIRAGYEPKVINVGDLAELAFKIRASGEAREEDGRIVIDLTSMGVHKLLGEGRISVPVKVKVPLATKLAAQKVQEAGGIVEAQVVEE